MWELWKSAFYALFQGPCGRVLCVHRSGSFHTPARASYGIEIGGLGHVDGSAFKAQHVQCLAETCAPSTRSVEHIPWEVAPRAPVQGR